MTKSSKRERKNRDLNSCAAKYKGGAEEPKGLDLLSEELKQELLDGWV